jgi:1,4-dihydroxy-2-naphthoyl-CoA hydrolase
MDLILVTRHLSPVTSPMPFTYERTIHFADTDAAGVVFFANYLAICHEAYEEALGAAGINLAKFFADTGTVVPIARSEAEYLRPLAAGDRIRVDVTPASLSENAFALTFAITRIGPPAKLAGRARTEHVCISSRDRQRTALPSALANWVREG